VVSHTRQKGLKMLSLIVALCVGIVSCLLYIRRLHGRLRGYEHIWEQIENVADRNLDGTFTINIQHLEEEMDPHQLHASSPSPGMRLLDLQPDTLGPHNPRAA
jgi:hypothetical protein